MLKINQRAISGLLVGVIASIGFVAPLLTGVSQAHAAGFTVFSIRPSRVQTSQTDVNFLVKFQPVTVATEASVKVTFDTGYTVDGTASNITTTEAGMTNWDSACANGPTISGNVASAVSGQEVTFSTADLTPATTYCFIITAGIDNPALAGNYTVSVATQTSVPATIDSGAMTLPTVDDDTVVISAQVAAYVRCDVTTTSGADNAIDLGVLEYGSTVSSTDDIQISGSTNAPGGMAWYYRSDATNNGLYSPTTLDLLDSSDAERTLSATTLTCTPTTPCYGIYYNGTTSSNTGTFVPEADFTGGTVTTDVGPMVTDIYGVAIGNTNGAEGSMVTADFNVNATASETSLVGSDYTDTLIFTCKAEL